MPAVMRGASVRSSGAAGGARWGLMLRRSPLRADSAAMLGPRSRRITRSVRFALFVQTDAASQRWKHALRAPTSGLRFSPPQKSPPPGTACRAASRVAPTSGSCDAKRDSCLCKGAFGQVGGAPLGRRGAEGLRPRAQRASTSDLPRLFERSERSERSELCGRPQDRAPQGSRREADDRPSEALRPARTRLCPPGVRMPNAPMSARWTLISAGSCSRSSADAGTGRTPRPGSPPTTARLVHGDTSLVPKKPWRKPSIM